MKRRIYFSFIIILFFSFGNGEEWAVKKSSENLVKFISDAPIEDFEGVTNDIDGYIYWEGENLLHKSQLYFEVNLNTIDTGIGLRNRHMRENYLETDKFPITYFKGTLIKAERVDETHYKVAARGKMFIHGVEQPKTIVGLIEKTTDHLNISSKFEIKLSDYHIKIPSLMFYKIDETMRLILDFHCSTRTDPNK